MNVPHAILEYPLPEYEEEFRAAIDGTKWKGIVFDLHKWLRAMSEEGASDWIPGMGKKTLNVETIEAVKAVLSQYLENEGLDLWR